jgi:hypothetical protein
MTGMKNFSAFITFLVINSGDWYKLYRVGLHLQVVRQYTEVYRIIAIYIILDFHRISPSTVFSTN